MFFPHKIFQFSCCAHTVASLMLVLHYHMPGMHSCRPRVSWSFKQSVYEFGLFSAGLWYLNCFLSLHVVMGDATEDGKI